MFENFRKLDKGRIKIKLMAVMLVITLTFSNFAILGSIMEKAISSYAEDIDLNAQTNETNNSNVKFDAYLMKDSTGGKIRETAADINSGETKLHLEISVEGEGYLNNAKIELGDTNFEIANKENLEIGTIESGKNVVLEIPVVANKNAQYNLGLLSMASQIKLVGEYVSTNGQISNIESIKYVKVDWTTDSITADDIELTANLLTNTVLDISETESKRFVQILVTAKLKENKAPVESATIEITNPEIGLVPETVKVSSYSTKATNGKTDAEFNDGVTSKWEYKPDEGKTYINTFNSNENNGVAWEKDCMDQYIVTYVYSDNGEITLPSLKSEVKATVKIYGRETEESTLGQTYNLEIKETIGEKDGLANLITSASENLYKGDLYVNGETTYETKNSLYMSFSDIAKTSAVIDWDTNGNSKVYDAEGNWIESEGIEVYYKSIKIKKEQAKRLLGDSGKLIIHDMQKSLESPIAEVLVSQETEGDYIEIPFEDLGKVKYVGIITSEMKNEGRLDFIFEKIVKVTDKELIEKMATIETTYGMTNATKKINFLDNVIGDETFSPIINKNIINLAEPKTTIDVSLDKTELSTQVDNEIKITAELKSNSSNHKLFDKPTIKIEIPKEFGKVNLENLEATLHEGELTLKTQLDSNKNLITTKEDGTRELVIELDGTQTKYNEKLQNATIGVVLKVSANPFMADKNVEIKATCINGEETVESKENIKLVSKNGLITKNTLTVGTNVIEKVNTNTIKSDITENTTVNLKSSIINNFGEKVSNINIVGNIPNGTTLTGAINVAEGVTVAYSENLTNWVNTVTDYSKVKAFKLSVSEMDIGSKIDLNYNLNVNADSIETTAELVNTLNLGFVINEQTKQDKIEYILNVIKNNEQPETPETPEEPEIPENPSEGEETNTEKLSVEVLATAGGEKVANGAEVNNGQVLRYKVKVTNKSAETIKNLNLRVTKQNGVFYDLVEYGSHYDGNLDKLVTGYVYKEVENLNIKEFNLDKLEAGRTKEFEYQVVPYIGNGENANKFKNDLSITANNIDKLLITDSKIIKEANLALKLSYSSNEEVTLNSNGDTKSFKITITNLVQKELKNIDIKMILPQELYCDINNQMYFDKNESSIEVINNQVVLNVYNLAVGETKEIPIKLETNSIPLDQLEKDIVLVAIAAHEGRIYKSNDYAKKIHQNETSLDVDFTSNKEGQPLSLDEEIVYTLTVINNGSLDEDVLSICDNLPDGMSVKSVVASINSEKNVENEINDKGDVEISEIELRVGEKLTLQIVGRLDYIINDATEITNAISISGSKIDAIEKKLINNIGIKIADESDTPGNNEEPEQPENNQDPEKPGDNQDPEQPENNENPEQPNETGKYSISGLAWLDSNKDGIRQSEEKTLQLIKVMLLDNKGNKVSETTTSLVGTYKFSNLDKGEYMVAFEYDTEKYAAAKYQVSNATEENNSDAISKVISLNNENKTVGITDTIKLSNKDITNIDIGLVENPKFDLSLNKYISKVVIKNKQGTKTYEYDETELAKVEIGAKYIAGTSLLVEYEIEIANEGDVNGYVTDIIDYLPKELEFNSEMNTEWYLGKDNNLHYLALNPEPIEPGKTQTVKLVLTKTLEADSTGTIENIAEISEGTCLEALKDVDSTSGNKQSGEDDIGKASLIVSIRTGSPMMYIGIVIASMIILGAGIYIIDKKVLKVKI